MAWEERAENKTWNVVQMGSLGKPSHIVLGSLSYKCPHHIPKQAHRESGLLKTEQKGAGGGEVKEILSLRSC